MFIKQIVTTKDYQWKEITTFTNKKSDSTIIIDRNKRYQKHLGFGGAVTDAACITFNYLSNDKKEEYLKAYFSNEGLGYNIIRYPLGSCDFSKHNYHYLEDEDINHLSIECDRDRINFVHQIKQYSSKLITFASPWSPPRFMKDNNDMNHGGKLKEEYYDLYAKTLLSSIKLLRKEGVDINVINTQNEPAAIQVWDSCIYSEKDEANFLSHYLLKNIKEMGINDLSIGIWDHNRDVLKERIDNTFSYDLKEEDVDYICFHWYSKSNFDQLDYIHNKYPSLHLVMSEGCVELLLDKNGANSIGDFGHAETYIHQIINDLNHYCEGYIDWNLSLDEKGGPNHVGNYCEAPIMVNSKTKEIKYNYSYYAIGHFSKYIKPGAVRLYSSVNNEDIELAAYENEDKSLAVVIYNSSNTPHVSHVELLNKDIELPLKSITTLLIK